MWNSLSFKLLEFISSHLIEQYFLMIYFIDFSQYIQLNFRKNVNSYFAFLVHWLIQYWIKLQNSNDNHNGHKWDWEHSQLGLWKHKLSWWEKRRSHIQMKTLPAVPLQYVSERKWRPTLIHESVKWRCVEVFSLHEMRMETIVVQLLTDFSVSLW